jgi:steroid delta-isomerase-like uncharacterized protein
MQAGDNLTAEREWGISTELTDEEEANLAVFEAVFPHWNSHDITKLLTNYDDEIVWVNIAMGERYEGKSEVAGFLERLFTGIPDLELDVTLRVPRGKYVAEEYHIRGHHLGSLFGVPPSKKYLDIPCVSMVELRNGRLLEDHFYWDSATALRQAGILPSVATMQKPLGRAAMRVALQTGKLFGAAQRSLRTKSPSATAPTSNK